MKPKGETFLEVLQKRTRLTTTRVLFRNLPQWAQDAYNEAAQEYEKATATDLPADVDAFLAEVEGRLDEDFDASKCELSEVARVARMSRIDNHVLLGIIRKQAAELEELRNREERMRPIDLAASHLSLSIDVNTLRSQLTRLQSETRDALNLLGPEYFDDGKPLAELGRLVNIKGESNG